jgi:hypothetical protein
MDIEFHFLDFLQQVRRPIQVRELDRNPPPGGLFVC